VSPTRSNPSDKRRLGSTSIRDVAKRAGVSIATVSRAVNRIPTVDPDLAKRVWQAIDEVGYLPNTQARALVSGRSRMLGLIVSEITNPFFPELVQEFENLAVAQGYEVLIGSTNYEPERTESLIRRMLQRSVDGVAVMTFGIEEELVQKLVEREMEVGHYPHLVAARAERLLADFIRDNYQNNQASFDSAVARVGLTSSEVRNDLIRQADLLTFLDLRFRPAVEVTPEDVRRYFDQNIGPKAGAEAFEQMRTQIEQEISANVRRSSTWKKSSSMWKKSPGRKLPNDSRRPYRPHFRPEFRAGCGGRCQRWGLCRAQRLASRKSALANRGAGAAGDGRPGRDRRIRLRLANAYR